MNDSSLQQAISCATACSLVNIAIVNNHNLVIVSMVVNCQDSSLNPRLQWIAQVFTENHLKSDGLFIIPEVSHSDMVCVLVS